MRTIPELLGHGEVSATMLHAAVRNKGRRGAATRLLPPGAIAGDALVPEQARVLRGTLTCPVTRPR